MTPGRDAKGHFANGHPDFVKASGVKNGRKPKPKPEQTGTQIGADTKNYTSPEPPRETTEERTQHVVDALYKKALAGNVVAMQVWLYNRAPEFWADKRAVAVTGSLALTADAIVQALALAQAKAGETQG